MNNDRVLVPRRALEQLLLGASAAFRSLLEEAARHPEGEARTLLVLYYGKCLREVDGFLEACDNGDFAYESGAD